MELSPEEYDAYWRASVRVTAGVIIGVVGHRVATPLWAHSELGAVGLGIFLFVALVAVGSFVATLGLARVVRTAVDAEMRG